MTDQTRDVWSVAPQDGLGHCFRDGRSLCGLWTLDEDEAANAPKRGIVDGCETCRELFEKGEQ